VLTKIREVLKYVCENKEEFIKKVNQRSNVESQKSLKAKTSILQKADRRISEIEQITSKLYEDYALAKISEDKFQKFTLKYETEQEGLVSETAALRMEIEEIKTKTANAEHFISLAEEHMNLSELTSEIARLFIEKITISEVVNNPDSNTRKTRKNCSRDVHIFLNGLGEFKVEEMR